MIKNKIKKMLIVGGLLLVLTSDGSSTIIYAENTQQEQEFDNDNIDNNINNNSNNDTNDNQSENTDNNEDSVNNENTNNTEESQEDTNTIQEPDKPKEPTGDNVTNDQITQYNQEVDNYNQQVDDYNKQIDAEYEQQVTDVNIQNAAIDEYNQSENDKAAAIVAENEQIQSQYDSDYAQYEQDLSTYEKKEKAILDAGYESVEQYNNTMNEYYNDPCKAAQEGNVKEENTFDIEKSYTIEKTEEGSSGETEPAAKTHKVEIEHTFNDDDDIVKSYKTEFEIGENDIITLEPAGAQLETYQNKYHYGFFANTDEDHIDGYWYLSDTYLAELCNYKIEDWNTGNIYTLSFKDGQSQAGDDNITMKYHYYWHPLKIVATYLKPEEPKLELKEEYTSEYKERITDPVKKDHLTYLNHLDLKEGNDDNDNDEPIIPITEKATPTVLETTQEETISTSSIVHHSSSKGGGSSSRPITIIETSPSIVEEEIIEEIPTPVIEESTTAFNETVKEVNNPALVGRNTSTGDNSTMNIKLVLCMLSCSILGIWSYIKFCKIKFFDFLKNF